MNCRDCNVIVFNFSSLHKEILSQYSEGSPLLQLNAGPPVVFQNHLTTSNWPYQALASQHTGQDLKEHRVFNNWYHNDIHWKKFNLKTDIIDPKTPVLLELAKENGMRTIFWGGKPHPSFYDGAVGFHRGADVVVKRSFHYQTDVPELSQQLDSSGRFFAFVNITRVHFPHLILPGGWSHPEYPLPKDSQIPATEELFWVENSLGWKRLNKLVEANLDAFPPNFLRRKSEQRAAYWYLEAARFLDRGRGRENFLAHYRRAIKYSEEMINSVIEDLRQKNLLQKTLIVITADTGDNLMTTYLGDDGHRWHNYITYMQQTPESFSIPLVFYFPESEKKLDLPPLTNHTDLIPTFQDLLAWKSRGASSGESVFSDAVYERRWLHSFNYRPGKAPTVFLHNKNGVLVNEAGHGGRYYEKSTKKIFSADEEREGSSELRRASVPYLPLLNDPALLEINEKIRAETQAP